jgi:NAD(P)-dependent dehydrogenase (short-subunit alcohol dehydrogenase family)
MQIKKRAKQAAIAGGVGTGLAAAAGVAAGVMLVRRLRAPDAGFRGQVVVITGSSRGLGLALAREFGARGARLVICGRDVQALELARRDLAVRGAEVLAVPCDISVQSQAEKLIAQAVSRFGRVDVLVNNAGIITVGPMAAQTLDDYRQCMDVMYWGTVYPTLAVLPYMRHTGGGRIANITSIGGRVSVPHLLPYNAAKFAAVGFSEGLRAELAREGIHVTTVSPGLMRTGSYRNAWFKGRHRAEYAWFGLSSSLPLLTISAERAARRIVRAIGRKQSSLIITPQAKLLALAHAVAPGATATLLGAANRLLPGTDADAAERHRGKESESAVTRSFLTKLGREAGERLNQFPEQQRQEPLLEPRVPQSEAS